MEKIRKLFLPLCLLFALTYMLLQPERTLAGSRAGLLLWFHTILPTLLPFLILSSLLLHTRFLPGLLHPMEPFFARAFGMSAYGGYAFFMGLFCGYPMGAKITADLFRENKISLQEASYLLSIANDPSPAFLITYVLHQELGAGKMTGRLLLAFYGSILISALLLRPSAKKPAEAIDSRQSEKKETSHPLHRGVPIDVSIMDSFETITKLGGYIILCSIGATALDCIPDTLEPVRIVFGSLLEISTGIHSLAALPLPGRIRIILVLCSASLGGFCILMQTYSVIRGTGLPISRYLKGKLVQTLITASILLLLT